MLNLNTVEAGQYSAHELGLEPEAYEPHLDVDFTKLEPDEPDGHQEAARRGARPAERFGEPAG